MCRCFVGDGSGDAAPLDDPGDAPAPLRSVAVYIPPTGDEGGRVPKAGDRVGDREEWWRSSRRNETDGDGDGGIEGGGMPTSDLPAAGVGVGVGVGCGCGCGV